MRTFIADPRSAISNDPLRRQAAGFLLPLAVMFLVAHEFWHIVGGHLGWLAAQYGRDFISEVSGMQLYPIGLSLRALEMDADGFAMYYTLMRALNMAQSLHTDLPTPLRGIVTTPLQALHVSLACALVMIGTFFRPPGPPDEWHSYSHPPSGVRHGMIIWACARALEQLGQHDLKTVTLDTPSWLSKFTNHTLRRLVQSLGNTDRQDGLLLAFGTTGQAHLVRILNAWGGMQVAVQSYAYMGE